MSERNRLIDAGSRVRLRLAGDERLVALVRRGDSVAFETLYDRHSGGLLSFGVYMLGSKQDAEDAVQATFASAYRALRADERAVSVRPWLFTIARNHCLSILRSRRPTVELNGEPALTGDPLKTLEVREEISHMLEGLRVLPERQRSALVLAELHGLSQAEIGAVLGVEADQVKAYIYQARSNLISERGAREADCREIREEIATARGAALLRGRLRRHMRSCVDCRVYADGVARQHRHLGAMLPFVPSLVLKYRAIEDAFGGAAADPATYASGVAAGGSVAGAAAEIAGGGVKALAVKMAAGVTLLGVSAGVGVSVLSAPIPPHQHARAASIGAQAGRRTLVAAVDVANTIGWGTANSGLAGRLQADGGPVGVGGQGSEPPALPTQQRSPGLGSGGGLDTGVGNPSESDGGNTEVRQQGTEAPATNSGEHPAKGREERQAEGVEDKHESQERRKRSEEDKHESQERRKRSEESQQKKSEERQQQKSEEREQKSEEHHRVGGSRPPPKSKEERQLEREEREKKRQEREQRRKEREAGK